MSDTQEIDVTQLDDAALKEAIASGGEPSDDVGQDEEATLQGEEAQDKATDAEEKAPGPDEKEEIEKLRKQVIEQKRFIDRQGNEIGDLRKFRQFHDQLMERKRALETSGVERFVENPAKFLDERDQINRQIEENRQAEEQAKLLNVFRANSEYAQQRMPDLADHLEEMASVFRESGDTEQNIAAFLRNPHAYPSAFVHSVYLTAKARKQHAVVMQELEKTRKQTEDTLHKVEAAARSKPLTNQSGGAKSGKRQVNSSQLPELSDEELKELIKQGSI